jgi:uncharacterized membrane protein YhaH (DUF805 family)
VSSPYSPQGSPGGGYGYGPPSQGYPGQQGYQAPQGGYQAPQGGYQGQQAYPGYQGPPQGYPGPQGYQQQRGYLQGGPVAFQSAIKLQLENVTNFNGRASLSAYWWYALGLFIVNMVLEIISIGVSSLALTLLIMLVEIVVGLTGLSVAVRRLHDTGKSGWMLLLGAIPIVGAIAVLVLLLLPGTLGENRYG